MGYDNLRAVIDSMPDYDSDLIARAALEQLSADDLVALLTREIDHIRRMFARNAERSGDIGALLARFGDRATPPMSTTRGPSLVATLATRFSLGDKSAVAWGQATIEQHQLRIGLLDRQIEGFQRTRDLHLGAIVAISRAGVSCLDEIEVEKGDAA